MRGQGAERILAEEPRLDLDPRETITVDREARDFLVGEPRAQRQALEEFGLVQQSLETLAVARLHINDGRQLVDHGIEILHPRRRDLERIRRIALGYHDAVAIAIFATCLFCCYCWQRRCGGWRLG